MNYTAANTITPKDTDDYYWEHMEEYPDLQGEQIKNKTHRDIMRLVADFSNYILSERL